MDLGTKVTYFYTALSDVYKSEENKSSMDIKIDLDSDTFTDDVTAMMLATFSLYRRLTGDKESDIVDFTHMLNKLAIQYIMESEEDDE